jgi:hypothetical protein
VLPRCLRARDVPRRSPRATDSFAGSVNHRSTAYLTSSCWGKSALSRPGPVVRASRPRASAWCPRDEEEFLGAEGTVAVREAEAAMELGGSGGTVGRCRAFQSG